MAYKMVSKKDDVFKMFFMLITKYKCGIAIFMIQICKCVNQVPETLIVPSFIYQYSDSYFFCRKIMLRRGRSSK